MTFDSNRIFRIWAYTASHNFLVVRSPKSFEDIEGYSPSEAFNIDIELWGVSYMDLPVAMRGVEIKRVFNSEIPQRLGKYLSSDELKVFEIQSEGSQYFVVAGGCRVGKSYWASESRVSNHDLEYDEVLAIS